MFTIADVQALSSKSTPQPATTNNGNQQDGEEGETKLSAATSFVRNQYKSDPTMDELRNYLVLMDQYSLHNFIIYQGHTLRETPEFQSFRKAYLHGWGGISSIIDQLELFLSKFEIKLAVVDGPRVYELSTLNLAMYDRDDLLSCIANEEQIKPFLTSLNTSGANQQARAAVLVQALVRRYLARKSVRALRRKVYATIKVQSYVRLMIFRLNRHKLLKNDKSDIETNREKNLKKLEEWWNTASAYPDAMSTKSSSSRLNPRSRLIIYIPSISCPEYIRRELDNFAAVQNAHISLLHQMIDPDVHVIYITPCTVGPAEVSYHETLLSIFGIASQPRRLHFVYPELCGSLAKHLSLAQVLLCSTNALRRVKHYMSQYSNVMLMPSSVTWAETKLADYFNIPILGPTKAVADTLHSRSYMKRLFMDISMNIPLGAHEISNTDDLCIALSRLIACNLDVRRWFIRLNVDFNNDSLLILDTEKFPIVNALRNEQKIIMEMNRNNPSTWFERSVQISARKRLLDAFQNDLGLRIIICRNDVFPNYQSFATQMAKFGAVVEAEPIETLGYIDTLFCIDPLGEIHYSGAVDVCLDEGFQSQAMVFPQHTAPPAALEAATMAVAQEIYDRWHTTGYFTLKLRCIWDALDNMPRLSALGLHIGMSPSFATVGITTILSNTRARPIISKTLVPNFHDIPPGRHAVHIPIAIHTPLKGTSDDIFFKLCRMRGVSFDATKRIGTLFFLVDTIVNGALSLICIAKSRRKALEMAIHAMHFIVRNFGKTDPEEKKIPEQALNIYDRLCRMLHIEEGVIVVNPPAGANLDLFNNSQSVSAKQ